MTVPKHHVRRRLLLRHNDSPLLFPHGVLEQKHVVLQVVKNPQDNMAKEAKSEGACAEVDLYCH